MNSEDAIRTVANTDGGLRRNAASNSYGPTAPAASGGSQRHDEKPPGTGQKKTPPALLPSVRATITARVPLKSSIANWRDDAVKSTEETAGIGARRQADGPVGCDSSGLGLRADCPTTQAFRCGNSVAIKLAQT